MSGDFAFRLGPYAFILVAFLVTLAITWLGFVIGRRLGPPKGDVQAAALNTALAAIFVIVGLILSFSFSFSVSRYEERWHLVAQEADAISTTYLRAAALRPQDRDRLRAELREYIAAKIEFYRDGGDDALRQRDYQRVDGLEQQVWTLTENELATRPLPGLMLLTLSVNDMFGLGSDQRDALDFRLRGPALALILLVSLVAAFLIGLGFGQSLSPHWLISIVFSILLVALVYTIIDLDSPQAGLIRVNLLPLVEAQQAMQER